MIGSDDEDDGNGEALSEHAGDEAGDVLGSVSLAESSGTKNATRPSEANGDGGAECLLGLANDVVCLL